MRDSTLACGAAALALLLAVACGGSSTPPGGGSDANTNADGNTNDDANENGNANANANGNDNVGPPDAAWGVPTLPAYEDAFEQLFALDQLRTIQLAFTLDEWNALLHDFDQNARNENPRRATFYAGADLATAVRLDDVGVRVRGNLFSRLRPEEGWGPHDPSHRLQRAHLKIKFGEKFDGDESVYGSPDVPAVLANDGRTFQTVRGFSLKHNRDDPTYLREVVSYDLFRRAGVQAPRAAFVKVYVRIADEPARYYGVFELIEDVDSAWVKRRFGQGGYLFKALWQQYGPADLSSGDSDGSPGSGRIGIEQTDPPSAAYWPSFGDGYRPAYDLKTREQEFPQAEAALNALITLLYTQPSKDELEAALDVQALLRAMVVNALVGMSDDYWRNGNNYFLAQDPWGRWTFVPYDYDLTLGFPCIGQDPATSPFVQWGATHSPGVNAALMRAVLAVPELRADFLRYLSEFTAAPDALFRWETLQPRLAALQALVGPSATGYDALSTTDYTSSLQAIESHVRARVAAAAAELGTAP